MRDRERRDREEKKGNEREGMCVSVCVQHKHLYVCNYNNWMNKTKLLYRREREGG